MALATTTTLRWIEKQLKSDSSLLSLIGSAPARIVNQRAGKGILFPYVLITKLDPARPVYVVGVHAIVSDGIYLVRGVHRTKSDGPPLETIAERIIALLHGQYSPDDGINASVLEAEYADLESQDDEQIRHLGGRFRITTFPV